VATYLHQTERPRREAIQDTTLKAEQDQAVHTIWNFKRANEALWSRESLGKVDGVGELAWIYTTMALTSATTVAMT
jgi:hypothetical protein